MQCWSDTEIAELRRLYDGGVHVAEIAERLGRTEYAVIDKLKQAGLNYRGNYDRGYGKASFSVCGCYKRWLATECDELKRLYKAGLTDYEIAERLNRSYNSVAAKRYALFGGGDEGRWSNDEKKKLVSMRGMGYTFVEIARQLGRTVRACENEYRRLRKGTSCAAHD